MLKHSSIHGRFQPFHNGHFAYFEKARLRSDFVYIGITRPFGELRIEEGENIRDGRHSQDRRANPFSFFQRKLLISHSLSAAGIPAEQYAIIPFPLENPKFLSTFFPKSGICYTTIKDKWNVDKISLLRSLGYDVEVLEIENSDDYLSGTELREMAAVGDRSWLQNVPLGVAKLLAEWDGAPVDIDYGFEPQALVKDPQ